TAAWRAAGRPFVVARRLPGDPAGFIRLGLATPEKRRVGLLAPLSAVARTATAPLLTEAARSSCAPPPWGPFLGGLAGRLAGAGFAVRVFGSLAWGFLTGLPYVRPDSDVDLLFEPDSWTEAVRLADLLSAETPPPGAPRLDGEIILPGGWGAAWRELAARPKAVLLKGGEEAVLRPYAQLADVFKQERAAA
ncbi:MAG TPA: malonate decarboxylase holo-[acyl-carrier-protein] synthase, partial [Azospirillaceae bacterium]|nr:malonate decarboxylase holo-[acyl-carrier-protein] synthase [Azospirillaceae bacterium]